jgi:ribulose-phosphate 3-epimerase
MVKISPSLLSADFTRLADEIATVRSADYLHFDVMDGVFVPNISVGIPVLEAVRRVTDLPLDAHLMITEPWRYTRRFAEAGADIVTFHVEACAAERILPALCGLRALGKRAGLSLKPGTDASVLYPYLEETDLVLVMTVEPGFGGQTFLHSQLPKLRALREYIDARGLPCEIEVDGGVNPETARLCVEHGAHTLVAGSDVFKLAAADRAKRISELRGDAV